MSKTCEKSLKPLLNDFHNERQKRMCFKQFIPKNRVKTLLFVQNSLTNDQNGQTT